MALGTDPAGPFGQGGGRGISAMVSLSIPQPDPGPCEASIPLASILPSAPQLHWLTTGPWCELTSLELRSELPGWLGVSQPPVAGLRPAYRVRRGPRPGLSSAGSRTGSWLRRRKPFHPSFPGMPSFSCHSSLPPCPVMPSSLLPPFYPLLSLPPFPSFPIPSLSQSEPPT